MASDSGFGNLINNAFKGAGWVASQSASSREEASQPAGGHGFGVLVDHSINSSLWEAAQSAKSSDTLSPSDKKSAEKLLESLDEQLDAARVAIGQPELFRESFNSEEEFVFAKAKQNDVVLDTLAKGKGLSDEDKKEALALARKAFEQSLEAEEKVQATPYASLSEDAARVLAGEPELFRKDFDSENMFVFEKLFQNMDVWDILAERSGISDEDRGEARAQSDMALEQIRETMNKGYDRAYLKAEDKIQDFPFYASLDEARIGVGKPELFPKDFDNEKEFPFAQLLQNAVVLDTLATRRGLPDEFRKDYFVMSREAFDDALGEGKKFYASRNTSLDEARIAAGEPEILREDFDNEDDFVSAKIKQTALVYDSLPKGKGSPGEHKKKASGISHDEAGSLDHFSKLTGKILGISAFVSISLLSFLVKAVVEKFSETPDVTNKHENENDNISDEPRRSASEPEEKKGTTHRGEGWTSEFTDHQEWTEYSKEETDAARRSVSEPEEKNSWERVYSGAGWSSKFTDHEEFTKHLKEEIDVARRSVSEPEEKNSTGLDQKDSLLGEDDIDIEKLLDIQSQSETPDNKDVTAITPEETADVDSSVGQSRGL